MPRVEPPPIFTRTMSSTCGSTDTRSGEPCGFPSSDNCPHHGSQLSHRKKRALDLLREGYTRTEAAKQCGVSRRTLYNWREKHLELFEDAIEEGERKQYEEVITAWYERLREGDHSGAEIIFFLKNKRPDLWRDRKSIEHSGPEGGPIEVDVDDARERLDRRITRIAERRRAASGAPVTNGAGG